jgi:hypothetical protein
MQAPVHFGQGLFFVPDSGPGPAVFNARAHPGLPRDSHRRFSPGPAKTASGVEIRACFRVPCPATGSNLRDPKVGRPFENASGTTETSVYKGQTRISLDDL